MPDAYLRELVGRLRAVTGGELVGVYCGGSYALGDYEAGRSDLDVSAVVRSAATRPLKEAIVAALRHESLPCPARGLEFVLYRLDIARSGTVDAGFELNLNTGARMPFRADFEPDPAEGHWFPIDRSILAQRGVTVTGPPVDDVFRPVPNAALLPVLVTALRWHREAPARGDDAVLNACRTLRYAREGVWSSKPEAGRWAVDRVGEPSLIRSALAARGGAGTLDREDVRRFLDAAAAEIASQSRSL